MFFRLLLLLLLLAPAQAQIVVPTFATRGEVPPELVSRFMDAFRERLGAQTGVPIATGELVTEGIAGSLEPDFTFYIAELGSGRYGISGEIAASENSRGTPQYSVNMLVGDAETRKTSDLISQPLSGDYSRAAQVLTDAVARFLSPANMLLPGSALLFISSEAEEVEVFVNGVRAGETGTLEPLELAPGRYEIEFRKEGFLPYSETVVLEPRSTTFVSPILTAINGGSILVTSNPQAQVYLEGVPMGQTPLALPSRPGLRELRLERPGFMPKTLSPMVRNFRVTRANVTLEPQSERLVFWDPPRTHLVFIDNLLRVGGYVADLPPGKHSVELRQRRERSRFTIDLPASGHFRLDLEAQRLEPFVP